MIKIIISIYNISLIFIHPIYFIPTNIYIYNNLKYLIVYNNLIKNNFIIYKPKFLKI